MKEGKAKSGNRGLVILLCVLGVVVVGLGIGLVLLNKSNSSSRIETVISKINEQYSGDVLSANGALVFYEYMEDKLESGEYTTEDIYQYYEDILKMVDNNTSKLAYLSYYSDIFFKNEQDLDGAVDILKRFDPDTADEDDIVTYYAILSNLYEIGGDTTQSEYYNNLLKGMAPSAVYDISEIDNSDVITTVDDEEKYE